ncbi:hypothetical protein C0Z17_22480 [Trinickia caryophylli]|nr:hypothetical protein C0Z17_22480 [Trinickia caryophylli]
MESNRRFRRGRGQGDSRHGPPRRAGALDVASRAARAFGCGVSASPFIVAAVTPFKERSPGIQ